jgi:hypothetical protein
MNMRAVGIAALAIVGIALSSGSAMAQKSGGTLRG